MVASESLPRVKLTWGGPRWCAGDPWAQPDGSTRTGTRVVLADGTVDFRTDPFWAHSGTVFEIDPDRYEHYAVHCPELVSGEIPAGPAGQMGWHDLRDVAKVTGQENSGKRPFFQSVLDQVSSAFDSVKKAILKPEPAEEPEDPDRLEDDEDDGSGPVAEAEAAPEAKGGVSCPHCTAGPFKNERGLEIHIGRAHPKEPKP